MIYGYARVSTRGQLENNSLSQQEDEIKERYPTAKIYKEQFTGTTTERPIFSKLIKKLQKGDTLVTTKLDRFCRTTEEGLKLIRELREKGVIIHILNMGLIEDTPMGELILTNLLAFSVFERNMIVERTQQGKEIARQNPNFREGRPREHKKKQVNHALDLLTVNGGKHSYTQVEELTGISKSTLVRRQRERRAKEDHQDKQKQGQDKEVIDQ